MKTFDENKNKLCCCAHILSSNFWCENGIYKSSNTCAQTIYPLRFEGILKLKYTKNEGYSGTTSYPFKSDYTFITASVSVTNLGSRSL